MPRISLQFHVHSRFDIVPVVHVDGVLMQLNRYGWRTKLRLTAYSTPLQLRLTSRSTAMQHKLGRVNSSCPWWQRVSYRQKGKG